MRTLVAFLILLAAMGVGAGIWNNQWATSAPANSFRTGRVERGDLQVSVSATGTIQPEEVVDVGAQVAGRIVEFGNDLHDSSKRIDYGSAVEAGTVLARIDDSVYASQVRQTRSQVEQAIAAVFRAEADLVQVGTQLRQAEREWTRSKKLKTTNSISDSELEKSEATYETSKSAVAVAEAGVVQAQRGTDVAKAVLATAETNLGYTTISSPINGVIIDRRVNIGQTVVSSLNAPSLFLIAKDLRRMQVWALVNEADIGRIYKGQAVQFTVDAYPDKNFVGEVYQIRLNASMTQNVVTYTVVVSTDNSDGKLLPYLTANVQFVVLPAIAC